jgi:hypothetical protein
MTTMTTLTTMPFDKLHELVFRLSERRRVGDRSCDELLDALLNDVDKRAAREDEEAELEIERRVRGWRKRNRRNRKQRRSD